MTIKMSRINIRRTHPQLYKTIFACSLVYFAIGSLAFLRTNHQTPVEFAMTAAFLVIGAAKLTALHLLKYRYLQIIQTVGLIYSLFYAIIFVVAAGANLLDPEVRNVAWLLPTWMFWTFTQALTIIEPPVNPASERPNGQHK